MDYDEYQQCIQILQTSTPSFCPQKTIEAKIRCLDTFRNKGSIVSLYPLLPFLKDPNDSIRYTVADTMVHLFRKFTSPHNLYESLKYLEITTDDIEYYQHAFPQDIHLYLFAIASSSSNGYVREAAITALTATRRPEALPYILLRLGDWVLPVRATAEAALGTFFHSEYRDTFLHQLLLVEWLSRVERVDLSGIQDEIYNFVISEELIEQFYKKLIIIGDKVRFLYARQYLQKKGLDTRAITLFQTDKNSLVRIELIKYLPQLAVDDQQQLLTRLLADKSAKVRLAALYAAAPFTNLFLPTILHLLSDTSASVRNLSRFLLRDTSIALAELYRQRVQEGMLTAGSILGLSEIGTKEDSIIFQRYLSDADATVQLACITALYRVDPSLSPQYCLQFLPHPSRKIRNKCLTILVSRCDNTVLATLRTIYEKGDYKQKRMALRFFSQVGGWQVLGDLLQSLTDEHEEIQNLGWHFLQRWKDRAVKLFTSPSPAALERANTLYKQIDTSKSVMKYYREKLWEELPFFFRR